MISLRRILTWALSTAAVVAMLFGAQMLAAGAMPGRRNSSCHSEKL